jgi:anti-anti-sigma factor
VDRPDLTVAAGPVLPDLPGPTVGPPRPRLAAAPPIVDNPAPDLLDGLLDDGEDTLSLVLDGAVDRRLETQLAEILDSIRSSGIRHIVLEMATVTAMDAAGLRFLVAVRCLADEREGTVRLAQASDEVLALVAEVGAEELLGLDGGSATRQT